MALIVLKNGFRFQGSILSENEATLTIRDFKLGATTIRKTEIAARTNKEDERHE